MLERTILATFIVLATLSAASWTYLIRRQSRGIELLPARVRDASPIGLVDVVLMFMAWIAAQLIAVSALSNILGMDLSTSSAWTPGEQASAIIWLGSAQFAATISCLEFYRRRYGTTSAFGLDKSRFKKDIKIGLIAFVFIIPPVQLIQLTTSQFVPYEHDTLEALKESQTFITILSTWFGAVLIAPLVEEIFFRGILQNWLSRLGNNDPERFTNNIFGGFYRDQPSDSGSQEFDAPRNSNTDSVDSVQNLNPYMPPSPTPLTSEDDRNPPIKSELGIAQVRFDSRLRWLPIVIASGLFAGAHVGQGLAWVPLFFLGLGLGYLYRQTQSIVPCIVVHFLLNFYSMFWVTLDKQLG